MKIRTPATRDIYNFMRTILIAIDCWHNMPDSQVLGIAGLQADLHVHHNPDDVSIAHKAMPDWCDLTRRELITYIHLHRPCVVTYVGQHWQMCLQNRPLGMRWMSQFRPWIQIRVVPSLCRFAVDDSVIDPVPGVGWPVDRTLEASDLGPGWRALSEDLYEMC